ncbi:EAL domain-containing protein [Marinomonas sp. 2405UD68-3]|uniref:EAL domain-containing protein n=1 Tax=Marinomonas sp. 2405UD68-3 TaxID=3391835 RepID=UPI0039C8CA07
MMRFVLSIAFIFLSLNVNAFDIPEPDGTYITQDLPTWIESTPLPPEEVLLQPFNPDSFPTYTSFSNKTFWHKLSFPPFHDEINQTFYLKVSNFMIDELNFYLFHDKTFIQEWIRGDTQAWNLSGPYEGIWIPISLHKTEETHLLIRRHSTGPVLLPIALYNEWNIEQAKDQQKTFWVIALTSLTILLFYNIVIYSLTRVSAFIYYVSFNAGLIVSLACILGFDRYFFYCEPLQQWLTSHFLTLQTFLLWGICRFSLHFLNLKLHYPEFWKHRFKIDTVLLSFLGLSYVLTESAMAPIFLLLQLIVPSLCVYWAIYTKSSHKLFTRLYMFSLGLLIIGSLVGSAIYWNLLPYNGFTEYLFLITTVVQLLGFSFAFSSHVRQANHAQHLLALTDTMTGLPNRQFLLSQLDSNFKKARKENFILNLVLIRLIGHHTLSQAVGPANADQAASQAFLSINDALTNLTHVEAIKWGHSSQVKLIRVSSSNCVFLTSSNDIDNILTELIPTFEKSVWIDGLEFQHNISIGVAQYPKDANTIEKLFHCAQLATEENRQIHNSWTRYDEKFKSNHKHQLNILSLLNRDLKNKQLEFHVQPKVSLKDQTIVGAEVLLRWTNKELGVMSPAVFIPLAEQAGLILKVTQYIIQEVFSWVSLHPHLTQDRHLSINISAKDLLHTDFSKTIVALKKQYDIPAHNIILEVTETSMFEDNEVFRVNVSLLRDHGFAFSVDDFGTGYSSMHNVITLDPVEIKLDRVFVKDINQSRINHILSGCIIDLCTKTRSKSTAEGIEKIEEMQTLLALNCQIGQGYFFHRPMTPDNYLALINKEDLLK